MVAAIGVIGQKVLSVKITNFGGWYSACLLLMLLIDENMTKTSMKN